MNKEIVTFSHNDLDAFIACLNIEFKFPNLKKTYFYTNYGDIEEKTEQVIQYIKENNIKELIITDVSFATSPECLKKLDDLNISSVFIDHHLYPNGFFDNIKMKVIYDKSKAACLLTSEFLGNIGKHKKLEELTRLGDIYDCWRINHSHFSLAQDFNEYFWSYDFEKLRDIIQKNDYNIPENFQEITKQIKEKYTAHIKNLNDKGLIQRSGGISFIFTDEWFNQAQLIELAIGQSIIIGITSFGIIRVRINEFSDLSDDFKNKLRKELTGEDNTGHLNAFSYKINGNFDKLIQEAEKISTTIERLK